MYKVELAVFVVCFLTREDPFEKKLCGNQQNILQRFLFLADKIEEEEKMCELFEFGFRGPPTFSRQNGCIHFPI